MLRLGVLVSGRGTNLQAIIDAIEAGRLQAEIVVVICNHQGVQAIDRARGAGIPAAIFEANSYQSRLAQQMAMAERLREADADLVVCAGWDRVLKPEFVRQFTGRIMNLHPSLLPAFAGGLHAIEDALSYGVKITGCTVHFVTEELDSGPIISQAAVPVYPGDTASDLAERVHQEEHRLLVEAIGLYAQNRLVVDGRVVSVRDET